MDKLIKVSLGAGKVRFPDFIHIDSGDYDDITYKDVINLPFVDDSLDLIYVSHLLAYFDREEIVPILNGWYSKLKSGGVLRISTTDFDRMVYIYKKRKAPLGDLLGPIFGRILINGKAAYHKTIYNGADLYILLKTIGFKTIRTWDWKRMPPHDKIDDQSRSYWPKKPELYGTGKFTKDQCMISLNIEAVK